LFATESKMTITETFEIMNEVFNGISCKHVPIVQTIESVTYILLQVSLCPIK
jgi:hypothetical protein